MQTMNFRIGHGYDIHRLVEGRTCRLGGVVIPSPSGPHGHSDGDVLLHALADAILGAVALPDIGHYFPDHDPACAGLDSRLILRRATAEARRLGYVPGNVDITVIAQTPRLAPHMEAMRTCLAAELGLPANAVGLKATTPEGLDALGRGEGLAVHAVVLLQSIEK